MFCYLFFYKEFLICIILMGNLEIDIEKLVEFGIKNALSLAEHNPTAEEFYERMTKAFSEYLNLLETDVKRLYNPFHWYFFCRDGYFSTNGNSPVKYLSKGHTFAEISGHEKVKSHGDIKLSRRVSDKERLRMIGEVYVEYGVFFNRIIQGINTSD